MNVFGQNRVRVQGPLLIGLALAAVGNVPAATIDVTYNGVACNTSNCADVPTAAQNAFNNIASIYGAALQNNVTVYVDVQWGTTDLGQSSNSQLYNSPTYTQWRTALANDSIANPGSTQMASAVASLPAATNPVTGDVNSLVQLTTANAKALGLSLADYGTTDTNAKNPDSVITFSNSANFEYTSTATPGATDFVNTAEHELDEALGISTVLKGDNSAVPSTLAAEDYFRYSGPGVHAVTNDPSATNVYFSADGGNTLLAQFNQDPGEDQADLNDWSYVCNSPGPYTQDARDCPGQVAPGAFDPGAPEQTVLQALGWAEGPFSTGGIEPVLPVSDVPEPGTVGILGLGLATLAWVKRRGISSNRG